MKLPRKTRKRLYGRQAAEFAWPEDAPDPHRGRLYPVYNEKGRPVFRVEVLSVKRGDKEVLVEARIVDDPHRPLFGISGTRNEWGDYETEPERPSAQFEDSLAIQGRQGTALLGAQRRREYRLARTEAKLDRAIANGNRKAQKTLERVRRAA